MIRDVVIIGGGLAGSASAIVLAKAGLRVTLIEARQAVANEFRAEKMGAVQMAQFDRLDLGEIARRYITPVTKIHIARFGRLASVNDSSEYGFAYADLVTSFRESLHPDINFVVGRVADIQTSDDIQSVTLQDGTQIDGRLIVVATGLGDAAKRLLQIERSVESAAHSISLGFNMKAPAEAFPFQSLVYYGEGPRDRIAYASLFPIKNGMRGNLFVYRNMDDPWISEFRASPAATMAKAMPGLLRLCGDLEIAGAPAVRPIDLAKAQNYRRNGVVLIGDAFMTCCPIVGMGIMKVLTDVERLCLHHVPRWLSTPGMSASKIAAFYDDVPKQECDGKSNAMSRYSRALSTNTQPVWAARRTRNKVVRYGGLMLKDAARAFRDRTSTAQASLSS